MLKEDFATTLSKKNINKKHRARNQNNKRRIGKRTNHVVSITFSIN